MHDAFCHVLQHISKLHVATEENVRKNSKYNIYSAINGSPLKSRLVGGFMFA